MMCDPWASLQLFADGGGEGSSGSAGSDGAAPAAEGGSSPETVVKAGGDGQQRLRELGVPKDVLERSASRRRARRSGRAAQAATDAPAAPEQSAAANVPSPEEKANEQPAQPEKMYSQTEVNEMIRKRVKDSQDNSSAAETLAKLGPTFALLAKNQGVQWDENAPNYDSLIEATHKDKSLYEPYALEWGCTPEEAEQRINEDIMYRNHFASLDRQAQEMQANYPGFDLRAEMQNPVFKRLTAPGVNLSVEDAYWAVHRKDLLPERDQRIIADTRQKVSQSIQSGSYRPVEAGATSQAPSATQFNYSALGRSQREQFKAELNRAWARGEKVYPKG